MPAKSNKEKGSISSGEGNIIIELESKNPQVGHQCQMHGHITRA
jgi:hypothetical protein